MLELTSRWWTRRRGIRLAGLCRLDQDGAIAAAAQRNLRWLDLLVFACPTRCRRARRELSGLLRDGFPILVFDLPEAETAHAPTAILVENLRRFFAIDHVLVLAPGEAILGPSRRRLERSLATFAAGDAIPAHRVSKTRRPCGDGVECTPERSASSAALIQGAAGRIDPSPAAVTAALDEGVVGTSGIWSTAMHRNRLYLDVPPFRHLTDRVTPRSVLDIGCGLGGYVQLFRDLGVGLTLGVDGFPACDDLLCPGDCYRQHDLREPLHLGRRFDVVICTEVIEHIEERFENTLLASICRHARRFVLFSAARPGQEGLGHVNCKPRRYWIEAWRRMGWRVLWFDTCAVRSLSTFYWFRRNLLLLAPYWRGDALARHFPRWPGGQVEVERAPWIAQSPHVVTYPLSAPLPALESGEELTSPDQPRRSSPR